MPKGVYDHRGKKKTLVSLRFWKYVDKKGRNECWEWTGSKSGKDKFRYGHIRNEKGVLEYAHRISWSLHNGKIPKGIHVLHDCDNPPCVNPRHLFLGTQKDNAQDALRKGRIAFGERVGCAKLTNKKVLRIRELYRKGSTLKQLACKFSVVHSTILAIIHKRTWKHS